MGRVFYGKQESAIIAGVAIFLMITHHLFSYPNWLLNPYHVNSIFGNSVNIFFRVFGRLGNICIYMFAFTTGYTICKNADGYLTFNKRIRRILQFLISYWTICLPFIACAYIFNEPLPTIKQFAANLFGLQTGFYSKWVNVIFAWYVLFYIFLILLSPAIIKLRYTNSFIDTAVVLGLAILFLCTYNFLDEYWIPIFATLTGFFTAKYSWFERFNKGMNSQAAIYLCFMAIAIILSVRAFILVIKGIMPPWYIVPLQIMEGIISFFFIFYVCKIFQKIDSKLLYFIFGSLGTLSMNLWFLHSYIFTGNRLLQHIVYHYSEPIVIMAFAFTIFVPVAILVKHMTSPVRKLLNNRMKSAKAVI